MRVAPKLTERKGRRHILSGKVSVMLGDGIYVSGLDAGTCFGEHALIAPDATRTANIVADTKS